MVYFFTRVREPFFFTRVQRPSSSDPPLWESGSTAAAAAAPYSLLQLTALNTAPLHVSHPAVWVHPRAWGQGAGVVQFLPGKENPRTPL